MANCFKCGRFLGVKEEWAKMDTLSGKICYVCFNRIRVEQDQQKEENRKRLMRTKGAGEDIDSQDR